MNTVVVISSDYENAREVCNAIENKTFEDFLSLREELNLKLEVGETDENQAQFFSLPDFKEECNEDYLILNESFISFVQVTKQ